MELLKKWVSITELAAARERKSVERGVGEKQNELLTAFFNLRQGLEKSFEKQYKDLCVKFSSKGKKRDKLTRLVNYLVHVGFLVQPLSIVAYSVDEVDRILADSGSASAIILAEARLKGTATFMIQTPLAQDRSSLSTRNSSGMYHFKYTLYYTG